VNGTISEEQLVPRLFIDSELSFSEISDDFFKILSKFQPFGPENMSPCLYPEMCLTAEQEEWLARAGSISSSTFVRNRQEQEHSFNCFRTGKSF